MRARLVFAIGAVLGCAAVVLGFVVLGSDRPRGFGWSGYAPLPRTIVLAAPPDPLALVLLAVGSGFVGAGVTGAVLIRRR